MSKRFTKAYTKTRTTIKDAMKSLGVSYEKCHSMIRKGEIVQVRYEKGTNKGTVYFLSSDILGHIGTMQER